MNTQTSAPESIIRKIQLLLNMAERGKNADPVLRQLRNDFVGSKFCK